MTARPPLTVRRIAARSAVLWLILAAVAVPVLAALPTHQTNVGGPAWWETDPTVAVLADIQGCAARVDAEVPAGALVLRLPANRVEYTNFDEGLAHERGGPGSDRTIAWCER